MKLAAGMSEEFAARVRRLRADFIATFPQRIQTLSELAAAFQGDAPDPTALRRLRSEVHQLRGAAGMYQLEPLHAAARLVEGALDEWLGRLPAGPIGGAEIAAALGPLIDSLARNDH